MPMELTENSGIIFENQNKRSDKAPDYSGTIDVNGEQWSIALWEKSFKNGEGFSVKISEPYVPEEESEAPTRKSGGSRPSGGGTVKPRSKPTR